MLYDSCNKHRDFIKVVKVVRSCKTSDHFVVARNMFQNFIELHVGDNFEEYMDFDETFMNEQIETREKLRRNV